MEIIHISAECYPVAKVGGLADVVGALPKYLNKLGHRAKVVVPGYDTKFVHENEFEKVHQGLLKLGWFQFSYSIHKEKTNKLGFELYLIAIPELFNRPNVYSYEDDSERFTAFQVAFLNWLTETNQRPDIIHCHDHHTGLIPFMMAHAPLYAHFKMTPTLLTIHNGQYQGWMSFDKLAYLPKVSPSRLGFLEWNGMINPLASAIKCAWKVTTVSPSYLEELSEKANGLENLLRFERPKCVGILNGIDTEVWNPETDEMITHHYSVKNVKEGKEKNKKWICEQFNLDPSKPLFTFIGRFVSEKGADLLPDLILKCAQSGRRVSFVVLGTGERNLHQSFLHLQWHLSGIFDCSLEYNETLAHQLYAGADFILMPSRVEPCGLNQMYAMRYGTVPIVRSIGGLRDTVWDHGDWEGRGFRFQQFSVDDALVAIDRAIAVFHDQKVFTRLQSHDMKLDFSWDSSAVNYKNLYEELV